MLLIGWGLVMILSCEARIEVTSHDLVTVDKEINLIENNKHDRTDKSELRETHKNLKKQLNKSLLSGFDFPLDALTLHHPFIHSSITEFEYSKWYFLFFLFFDKPSKSSMDVSLTVPEIRKSLSSKLSVPASVFSISRAEKYRTKSISANLSLTNYTIPRLHHKLSNLQDASPLFWIQGTRFKLVQVIHDKNHHLYMNQLGQVTPSPSEELGMLVALSVGGIVMFLLVIILTVLAAKLVTKDTTKDDTERIMDAEDDEFGDHFENIENEKAIFTIDEMSKFGSNQKICPKMLTGIK